MYESCSCVTKYVVRENRKLQDFFHAPDWTRLLQVNVGFGAGRMSSAPLLYVWLDAVPRKSRPEIIHTGTAQMETETNRIEAFSDGVFAIAMTLLILEIKVPGPGMRPLSTALLRQWPSYLA